jgi:hypothetical protein
MKESRALVDAWQRFCAGVTEGKIEEFDDIVSDKAHLIIGTAPGENVSDREAMKFGFRTEGITLESRSLAALRRAASAGWLMNQDLDFLTDREWIAE